MRAPMKQLMISAALIGSSSVGVLSFAPSGMPLRTFSRTEPLHAATSIASMDSENTPNFDAQTVLDDQKLSINTNAEAPKPTSKASPPKAKKPAAHGKTGILSPVVLAAKAVMGNDSEFNKLRGKVISMHSNVIESFVIGTSDTPVGKAVLKRLFEMTDLNKNGSVDVAELSKALHFLGFEWLKEKQINGILEKADLDRNGTLDLEEWIAAAPKTLKTNLMKLAKKNGGELGLLA